MFVRCLEKHKKKKMLKNYSRSYLYKEAVKLGFPANRWPAVKLAEIQMFLNEQKWAPRDDNKIKNNVEKLNETSNQQRRPAELKDKLDPDPLYETIKTLILCAKQHLDNAVTEQSPQCVILHTFLQYVSSLNLYESQGILQTDDLVVINVDTCNLTLQPLALEGEQSYIKPTKIIKLQLEYDVKEKVHNNECGNVVREYKTMKHFLWNHGRSRVAKVFMRACMEHTPVFQGVKMPGIKSMVMEHAGSTLSEWLEQFPSASMVDRGRICLELIQALHEVHFFGFVHNNLSLNSICFSADPQEKMWVKLIGFGKSTILRAAKQGILTQTTQPIGIPGGGSVPFMSYEKLTGKRDPNFTDDLESASLIIWKILYPADFDLPTEATYDFHDETHLNSLRKKVYEAVQTAPKPIQELISICRNAEMDNEVRAAWKHSELQGTPPPVALNQVYNVMLTIIADVCNLPDFDNQVVPKEYTLNIMVQPANDGTLHRVTVPARMPISTRMFPPHTLSDEDVAILHKNNIVTASGLFQAMIRQSKLLMQLLRPDVYARLANLLQGRIDANKSYCSN